MEATPRPILDARFPAPSEPPYGPPVLRSVGSATLSTGIPQEQLSTPTIQSERHRTMSGGAVLRPITLHSGRSGTQRSKPASGKKHSDLLLDLSRSESSLDTEEVATAGAPRMQVQESEQEAACTVPTESKLEAADADSPFGENDWTVSALPSQAVLQVDMQYKCVISYEGTPSKFYITVNPIDELGLLTASMHEYYQRQRVDVRPHLASMSYCAVYEDSLWYRCFIANAQSEDRLQVYFVDFGWESVVSVESVQPLLPRFCVDPPYARPCHLFGVEPAGEVWPEKAVRLFHCTAVLNFTVDDNSSESLGVTLFAKGQSSVNQLLLNSGLVEQVPRRNSADGALAALTSEVRITPTPKRLDERSGDGWTQYRMEAVQRTEPMVLPAQGSCLVVSVTCVLSYKRFYVHILDLQMCRGKLEVLPSALAKLIGRMNAASVVQRLLPFELMPSPGELVAAWCPDKKLYRAQVIQSDHENKRVQVLYVDSGNLAWTRLQQVYELEEQFATLPFQAVECFLADIALRSEMVDRAKALEAFKCQVLEKKFIAIVVGAVGAKALLVEMHDASGFGVAETAVTQHGRLFQHSPDVRPPVVTADSKVLHLPG